MGRPPKPTHLKLLGGERRPSRVNYAEPQAELAAAEPPERLSENAAGHFRRLSAILLRMGIASPCDGDMLALLSARLTDVEELSACIEDGGRSYQSDGGLWRPRPEVAMRNAAMRHCQQLLAEFGLSPAARSKVTAGRPAEENPFAVLDRAGEPAG